MRTSLRIVLGLVAVVALIVAAAYIDGTTLPVNHVTQVTATVPAPPAKVFSLITNVSAGASWRRQVKAVTVLPPDNGHDHWVEDLGHDMKMDFLAIRTTPLTPAGSASREVLLQDPQYGGTWLYEVSPGPTPRQTTLKITESGFIHPPLYRFAMHHVFGMTHNLDQYESDIQAAAAKP